MLKIKSSFTRDKYTAKVKEEKTYQQNQFAERDAREYEKCCQRERQELNLKRKRFLDG